MPPDPSANEDKTFKKCLINLIVRNDMERFFRPYQMILVYCRKRPPNPLANSNSWGLWLIMGAAKTPNSLATSNSEGLWLIIRGV